MNAFAWLQSLAIARWLSESQSLWGYPVVLTLHTVGMSLAVGINTVIDLRLLGIAPEIPIEQLRRLMPLIWAGLAVNVLSGALLFAADATTKGAQPMFWFKLTVIAAAVACACGIRTGLASPSIASGRAVSPRLRRLAMTSLTMWVAAIAAGRLLAYF